MLNVLQIIGSGDIGEGIFPTVSDWVVTDGFYEEVTFESSPEWRKEATYRYLGEEYSRRKRITGAKTLRQT